VSTTFNKIAASDTYDCDELYTPRSLVEIIGPFFEDWLNYWKLSNRLNGVEKSPIVWLPFDTANSEFVKFFKEKYPDVTLKVTHITDPDGKGDFFDRVENEEFDIVISNPPFSEKLKIFKALDDREKPWALVCNMMAINYQEVGEYFVDHPVGFIIPDKKISCNGKTSSFCLGYYCSERFYKGVTFIHVENNNTNANYVASSMMQERDEIIQKVAAIKEEQKKNGKRK